MRARAPLLLLCIATLLGLFAPRPALAHTITVDGKVDDWLAPLPEKPGSGLLLGDEFVWRDHANDDFGSTLVSPEGYKYPANESVFGEFAGKAKRGGPADILEFRVTHDEHKVYFLVVLNKVSDIRAVVFTIAIHTGDKVGMDWIEPHADLHVGGARPANVMITFAAGQLGFVLSRPSPWTKYPPKADPRKYAVWAWGKTAEGHLAVEIGVDKSLIGDPAGKTWYFLVIAGARSRNDIKPGDWPGFDHVFAEIRPEPDSIHPGGGVDGWQDPNFFDICFNGTVEEQLKFMNSWKTSAQWPNCLYEVGRVEKAWLKVSFPSKVARRTLVIGLRSPVPAVLLTNSKVRLRVSVNETLLGVSEPCTDAKVTATVVGTPVKAELKHVGAGVYEGELKLSVKPGEYTIRIEAVKDGLTAHTELAVTVKASIPAWAYAILVIVAVIVGALAYTLERRRKGAQ